MRVRYGVEKALRQGFVCPSQWRAKRALRTLVRRSIAPRRLPGLALPGCPVTLRRDSRGNSWDMARGGCARNISST